ncbi:MAG: hypothetical protein KGM43_18355 [Planctomycetota bacterium]|nr:hypothetical protein [Planctomycetota bacterium]
MFARVRAVINGLEQRLRRPVGAPSTCLVYVVLAIAAGCLYFDPFSVAPRDAVPIYILHSDDFPYLSSSRTLPRALANAFRPHNTHVAPAWRLVCWGASATAGKLANLPPVLAVVSFGALVALMLIAGRFVARETSSVATGCVVAAVLGCSSVMTSAVTWFSAGQTIWASLGILASLRWLQRYRRNQHLRWLVAGSIAAGLAGWFWTVGYAAGVAGALYLIGDERPRVRRRAFAPVLGVLLAAGLAFGLGASKIDARVSFHGRTTREAFDPVAGTLHCAQALVENLLLGNLGLTGETTIAQAVVLSTAAAACYLWIGAGARRFNSLALAGLGLLAASSWVEWSVRGYLPFSSLRGIVPWYDVIPDVGLVLFVAGWSRGTRAPIEHAPPRSLTLGRMLAMFALAVALVVEHRQRVEHYWASRVAVLTPSERERFPVEHLRRLRTNSLAMQRAEWQMRHLMKLDRAEARAWQLGITREDIARAFGRIDAPNLAPVYDVLDLLDLPAPSQTKPPLDVAFVRDELIEFFRVEPEPRPVWVPSNVEWPPPPAKPDVARDEEDRRRFFSAVGGMN